MLDLLPHEIWSDPDATFLDPACKSGVFLREIAKRLIDGLEGRDPDLQERLDHIYKKQIFGIAITELTSLLSRRSLYCSKYPNSKYSVVRFDGAEGNVRYKTLRTHVERMDVVPSAAPLRRSYDRGERFRDTRL
jgi:type I restriction-modification system DNA methylase subunit